MNPVFLPLIHTIFPVQPTTSRIGILITLHTLLYVKTIHTYIHNKYTYMHTYHLQVYCIKLKVHSTKSVVFQNMITAVSLWNRVKISPSRLVPVQKCLQFIENIIVYQNVITAVLVLLWQPAVILWGLVII